MPASARSFASSVEPANPSDRQTGDILQDAAIAVTAACFIASPRVAALTSRSVLFCGGDGLDRDQVDSGLSACSWRLLRFASAGTG
jgi:uncharacterized protein with von Willebrand factor type A (vWA) domain